MDNDADSSSTPDDEADASAVEELEEASEVMEPDVEVAGAPPELHAAEITPGADVTMDDMAFIQRVFNQVKDVDFRTPPPPPPRGLSGPDKKMQDLREKVRKLERELARVAFIWTNKAEEVLSVDKIVREKEAERATAVSRYRQFKERAVQALTSHKEQIESLNAVVESLTTDKNQLNRSVSELQSDLSQERDEKNALMVDFRAKMEAAQTAFQQLRDQSSRAIGNLEAQVAARDASLEETRQQLQRSQEAVAARGNSILELEKRVVDLDARERTAQEEIVKLKARLEDRDRAVRDITERLSEREKTTAQLAEQMAGLRTENEQRLGEVRAMGKVKEDENARLQAEIKQLTEAVEKSQAETARLKGQLVQ